MAISRQRNQSGPTESACDAWDAPSRLDTGCKVLPFRQTRLRESFRPAELAPGCVVAEPDVEESVEARKNFLTACLPEYPERVSCQGCSWAREEPAARTSFLAGRWLKKLLLLSTFTAWTAAAIAIAIALD